MLQTCCLSQLSADMTELPVHVLSSDSQHDDSRLDRMEHQINTVTTAVHKTGNFVLDLHRVITTPQLRRSDDDDSSLQSINSLQDFFADQPDFRKAAQQK